MELRTSTNRLLKKDHPHRSNITLQESRAVKGLERDSSRVIFMVDKGVAMVIMDRQDYVNKAHDLLMDQHTYKPISKDCSSKLKNQLIHVLRDCKTQEQTNDVAYESLYPTCAVLAKFMDYPKFINKAPPQTHSIQ